MTGGRAAVHLFSALGLVALLGASLPGAQAYVRNHGGVKPVNTAPRPLGASGFTDADINVIENLGQRIPAGLRLVDGHGHKLAVDDLLGRDKPLLVTLGYYRCPLLCNLVHERLARGLSEAGLKPGRDFQGLAVSVDPDEDPRSAATNQRKLLRALGVMEREDAPSGAWPFLMPDPLVAVNRDAPAAKLAEAVGFRYKYDAKSKQFAHAAVAFVLSPEGKISRYLYGVEFKPRDLRLALVEASDGRVGTTLDRVLLTCFKYDPMTQSYTPFVFGFVRIGAGLSFAALAVLLAVLWRREWQQRRRKFA
jgi:protein SCO1/2